MEKYTIVDYIIPMLAEEAVDEYISTMDTVSFVGGTLSSEDSTKFIANLEVEMGQPDLSDVLLDESVIIAVLEKLEKARLLLVDAVIKYITYLGDRFPYYEFSKSDFLDIDLEYNIMSHIAYISIDHYPFIQMNSITYHFKSGHYRYTSKETSSCNLDDLVKYKEAIANLNHNLFNYMTSTITLLHQKI